MVDYIHKDLYNDTSVDKQLKVTFNGGELTNKDFYAESFELTESLCSEDELRFGCSEASVVKFKIAYNSVNSLVGKEIVITEKLGGNSDAFQFGKYKVYSDIPDGDRNFRNVTAYDSLYDIIQTEVSDWYNGLTFPLTLKAFRNSFFDYLGVVEQVDTTLINDFIEIERTIGGDNISAKTVLNAICEINGVFGHINRQGKFEYIQLQQYASGLYPSDTLYPSDDLYPSEDKATNLSKSTYIRCEYEDYKVQTITKLQIRTEEDDIGAIVGDGYYSYVIQDNFLVYGKSADDLLNIANNVLTIISNITYRPFQASARGNPCLEVGDFVRLYTKHEVVESYILTRTLKGIQALRDTYTSKGEEEYSNRTNSVMTDLIKLKGKTNTLTRTVEETKSEIKDVENGLNSKITQTAESITAEVSKKVGDDEIISKINQSAESVEIDASKISLNGAISANDNVVIGTDGKLNAVGANIEGTVKSGRVTITDGYLDIYGAYSAPDTPGGVATEKPSTIFIHPKNSPTQSGAVFNYQVLRFYNADEQINTIGMEILATRDIILYKDDGENWGTWIDETGVWSESLTITGTKAREIETSNYGKRLEYCYEMPTPYFGDIGEGATDDEGTCYIFIDDIFAEIIDKNCQYQVFLQAYGDGTVYVSERNSSYFIVKGTPNMKFAWEMKAVQRDYEMYRLDNSDKEKEITTDYATDSYDYLTSLLYDVESEV